MINPNTTHFETDGKLCVIDKQNSCAYVIDKKKLEIPFMHVEPREDGLTSLEYDVSLVPEYHEPVFLLGHTVELLPEDRRRLNNQLIEIFGTKEVSRFRFNNMFSFGFDFFPNIFSAAIAGA